jgi:hypothetical protein
MVGLCRHPQRMMFALLAIIRHALSLCKQRKQDRYFSRGCAGGCHSPLPRIKENQSAESVLLDLLFLLNDDFAGDPGMDETEGFARPVPNGLLFILASNPAFPQGTENGI